MLHHSRNWIVSVLVLVIKVCWLVAFLQPSNQLMLNPLLVHHVKLEAMKEMFDCHGYPESCDTVIGCEELQELLTSVYQTADQAANVTIQQAEVFAQLLQNLVLNLFDVYVIP